MEMGPTTLLELNSAVPLYAQLLERFRRQIESGELKPGDRFPAELDLAQQYGVARITIRRAIEELVQDGLLVRRQGKGSFVAAPKIDRELVNVSSFTARMQARGLQPGSKVVGVHVIAATGSLAHNLGVPVDSPVAEIQRVRYANDEPMSLEASYVSLERCPGINQVDFNNHSLYQVLESIYSLRPAGSRKTLELAFATHQESQLLQVSAGAPLFLLKAVVSTADDRVMEYAKLLFRGDRFRFQV